MTNNKTNKKKKESTIFGKITTFAGSFWSKIVASIRKASKTNMAFYILTPIIVTVCLEWVSRGTFEPHKQNNGFFQAIFYHFPSFFISMLLLFFVYLCVHKLTNLHSVSVAVLSVVGLVPAIASYYKQTWRNEPLLPWDLGQINDLIAISSEVEFDIQPPMIISGVLLLMLVAFAAYIDIWQRKKAKAAIAEKPEEKIEKKSFVYARLVPMSASILAILCLMLFVFLNPVVCKLIGIKPDMWLQDRYYRNHGVVTGFLTNLQVLQIDKPSGYGENAIQGIVADILDISAITNKSGGAFENTPAQTSGNLAQQPDIIYVMGEAFWDMTRLPGVEFDEDIMPNITALKEEAAYGYSFSPSYGGGTCDVEFEALTGFSMEHLPSGSKPYQQYTSPGMFSLPNHLLNQGYDTLAIHGYGGRFWNRDKAYPNLGIDEFFPSESFINPERVRGFVSDNAMVDKIIEEYSARASASTDPVFIHSVTMQNHGGYSADRYPDDVRVGVTQAPSTFPEDYIGRIEDCATGIRDMDAAIGKLTSYLRTVERETIIVFWGDHLNSVLNGYTLFEETGAIEYGDYTDPFLRQTPLLIWSNYSQNKVDLGTVPAYGISPVMMELYNLDKPFFFEFISQNLDIMRGRTRGVTINPDGTFDEEMTDEQQDIFDNHAMLQYDLMFGDNILLRMDVEEMMANSGA